MFLVWLGELITENGIGNGISLIIFGGIVAGMPGLLNQVFNSTIGIFGLLLVTVVAVGLVASIVWMQEAIAQGACAVRQERVPRRARCTGSPGRAISRCG